jgi:hypothetical protein
VEIRYRRSVDLWSRRGYCHSRPTEPSTFGLTIAELRAEANRLIDNGWTAAEMALVLDLGGPS